MVFGIGDVRGEEPRQRIRIVVGSELDYPPYALVTPDGEADGFSVDLMKAVCAALEIDVTFRVGPWSEVRTALEKGEIDALPLVSYSKEREEVFDFTAPHTITYGVVFKRKKAPDIESPGDLRDKTIIVMQSDAGHDWLLRNDISDQLILTQTVAESLQLLANGKADYALAPHLVGLLTAKELDLSDIEVTGPLLDAYGRGFGFAVKEGNLSLLTNLNEGLSIIKATGEYGRIYDKWFGDIDPKGISTEVLLKYLTWIAIGGVVAISVPLVWSISLKRKVAQQTIELRAEIIERKKTEEKLHLAMQEAKTANKAKSEFLANMSHELRTPLNSIIGFSEMMEYEIMGPLPETYHEYSGLISTSGRLLLETVNGILDLAKIEAGKFDLRKERVFMGDLVTEAFSLLNVQAKAKGIELVNVTHDLPHLLIDPMRIKQVLLNVMGNAIKFTDAGNVTLSNYCNEAACDFFITDTGIGMTPAQIEIALQPFRQVHGTSFARRYQGTGLGLSLSRQIMTLHGGELTVTSIHNVGTTVTLRFPPKNDGGNA
ncbi:MAG: transporter substrate-binding domain-containing protein [Rhodospirillales bacterium]|nr:transporter substrate-binding domain-containing protein [Rhodospirillales bacterium]